MGLLRSMLQVTGSHRGQRRNTCKFKGEDRHTGSMCQGMQELPGKDSGKGSPGEAVLVTLRLAGVWPGDQQPWGECEEEDVQCRSPGEEGDRHPCLGQQ